MQRGVVPSFYGDDCPIAAIATAVSTSALAVIRLSGSGSLELLSRVFSRPAALAAAPGQRVVHGWILSAGVRVEKIDEVLVSVYRAPKSYTGEDGADISCHGGSGAVRAVAAALFAAGFREALPGEFTFRAFLNGKLDLSRAEAVMELVSARTGAAVTHAARRLSGVLEAKIRAINEEITGALAETELYLDYSELDGLEEPSGADGGLPARAAIEHAAASLRSLGDGFTSERLYREGLSVVLAGPPNAGKSSLFNRLIEEERSIVSEIPGTTRDWVEAWISLDGIPVRLIDTAGLRVSEDAVEKTGVERSRNLLAAADMAVFVIDGTDYGGGLPLEAQNRDTEKSLLVWNKADLAPSPPSSCFMPLSAKTGEGIDRFRAELGSKIAARCREGETDTAGGAALGSERQKTLVDSARAALQNALSLAADGAPLDIIAPELRAAVNALGEITGEVRTADILEEMFSRFCVGK
jgi:tRNA modification GTPase